MNINKEKVENIALKILFTFLIIFFAPLIPFLSIFFLWFKKLFKNKPIKIILTVLLSIWGIFFTSALVSAIVDVATMTDAEYEQWQLELDAEREQERFKKETEEAEYEAEKKKKEQEKLNKELAEKKEKADKEAAEKAKAELDGALDQAEQRAEENPSLTDLKLEAIDEQFEEIYSAAKQNELRFADTYEGNRYIIRATINGMTEDGILNWLGEDTITVTCEKKIDNTYLYFYAKFNSEEWRDTLLNYNVGDEIVFEGECGDWGYWSECEIIQ